MSRFENFIYGRMKAVNPLINILPKDDVMQEIRFAILTANKGEEFKVAGRLIHNLARDYGYSRKKGKDNFNPFYNMTPSVEEDRYKIIDEIERLYLTENYTAREIAEYFGIKYTKELQKCLFNLLPKGLGHGGKRKNSGQKKKKIIN